MWGPLRFVVALALGLLACQAPAFTDQARQHLAGRAAEAARSAAAIEATAATLGLAAEDYAARLARNEDQVVAAAGRLTHDQLRTAAHLESLLADLDAAGDLGRPLVLLRGAERLSLAEAWERFRPALPLSPAAWLYGLGGALLGLGLVQLLRLGAGAVWRRRKATAA